MGFFASLVRLDHRLLREGWEFFPVSLGPQELAWKSREACAVVQFWAPLGVTDWLMSTGWPECHGVSRA